MPNASKAASLVPDYARLLRSARLDAGLSLRELAGRIGTSHATLVAYESGTKEPKISTFLRVLHGCELKVDFELHRRVRWRNGLARGEELAMALELAEHFPNRNRRSRKPLQFSVFAQSSDDT